MCRTLTTQSIGLVRRRRQLAQRDRKTFRSTGATRGPTRCEEVVPGPLQCVYWPHFSCPAVRGRHRIESGRASWCGWRSMDASWSSSSSLALTRRPRSLASGAVQSLLVACAGVHRLFPACLLCVCLDMVSVHLCNKDTGKHQPVQAGTPAAHGGEGVGSGAS
jgi:hypothetical protein